MKKWIFLSALLVLAIIVLASPSADLQSPTEPDNAYLNRNYTFINISTNITNVDTVKIEWNGTNATIDDSTLVLNMRFEENSTGVNDSSRYGNNGTAMNSPYFNSSGRFGNGWTFGHGLYSVINVSNSETLNFGGGPFTVGAWINKDASTVAVVLKGNGQDRDIWLAVNNDKITGGFEQETTGNNIIATGGTALLNGTWYYLAVTYDGTNSIIVYVNGIQDGNLTDSTDPAVNSDSLVIGRGTSNGFTDSYNVTIDEVRVWRRTLTNAEINTSMKATMGRYNATQFFFNTTDLAEGTYTWQGIINSTTGESNRTARRTVTIDANPASEYATGMDADNVYLNRNYTFINISTGGNIDTVKIEWNGTNVTIDGPDLVLNMHFEENSTGVNDSSRYGNNGTTANSPYFNSSGRFGNAWSFNGINNSINISGSASLNLTNTATISAWIKLRVSPLPNNGAIAGKDWNQGYLMMYDASFEGGTCNGQAGIQTNVNLTQFEWCNSVTPLANTNWHYVAYVNNGTTEMGFIDGILVNSRPYSGGNFINAGNVYIGNIPAPANIFNGTIDEVRIYNRALSDLEINASMKATMGRYTGNATQFYFNTTDLIDGAKSYAVWLNDTSGETKRFVNRAINIDRICSPPDAAAWAISTMCSFTGRALSTAFNLTLQNGGNITLINSNITFTSANQFITVFSGSQLVVNSGSKLSKG